MQISNTNYSPRAQKQSNPSFGVLHMDKVEIARRIGQYAADAAEAVRPQLDDLA